MFRNEMCVAVALFIKANYPFDEFIQKATNWGYYECESKTGKYIIIVKYLGYQSEDESKLVSQ